jgi:hypothetical protein
MFLVGLLLVCLPASSPGRVRSSNPKAGQTSIQTRRRCELLASKGYCAVILNTSSAAVRIEIRDSKVHQGKQGARFQTPDETSRGEEQPSNRKRASEFEPHDDQEWTPGGSPKKRSCRRTKSHVAEGQDRKEGLKAGRRANFSDLVGQLKHAQAELQQKRTELVDVQKQHNIDMRSFRIERDGVHTSLARLNRRFGRLEVENQALEAQYRALEADHQEEMEQVIAHQTELNNTLLQLRQERSQQTTIIPSSTRSDSEHGQSLRALNTAIDSFAFRLFKSHAITSMNGLKLPQGKPFGIRNLIVAVLEARIMSGFCPEMSNDAQLRAIYYEIDPQRWSCLQSLYRTILGADAASQILAHGKLLHTKHCSCAILEIFWSPAVCRA